MKTRGRMLNWIKNYIFKSLLKSKLSNFIYANEYDFINWREVNNILTCYYSKYDKLNFSIIKENNFDYVFNFNVQSDSKITELKDIGYKLAFCYYNMKQLEELGIFSGGNIYKDEKK